MSELERIQRYIDKSETEDTKYSMRFNEVKEICQLSEQKPFEAICLAFDYGKAKGVRMERKAAHE